LEFAAGSVVDAVNVPLPELAGRLEYIRTLNTPIIVCCASGSRSGMAQELMNSIGIDCINGGSWLEVNYMKAMEIEK